MKYFCRKRISCLTEITIILKFDDQGVWCWGFKMNLRIHNVLKIKSLQRKTSSKTTPPPKKKYSNPIHVLERFNLRKFTWEKLFK